MTESASVSIGNSLADDWLENPGGSFSQLTLNFGELSEQFCGLMSTIGSMSPGYTKDAGYLDELHFQNTLDKFTDQMHHICVDLGALPATSHDHLKLKMSALLYLLPEEDCTELELAKSLLADFERGHFEFSSTARK